jgi:hypothetical protein
MCMVWYPRWLKLRKGYRHTQAGRTTMVSMPVSRMVTQIDRAWGWLDKWPWCCERPHDECGGRPWKAICYRWWRWNWQCSKLNRREAWGEVPGLLLEVVDGGRERVEHMTGTEVTVTSKDESVTEERRRCGGHQGSSGRSPRHQVDWVWCQIVTARVVEVVSMGRGRPEPEVPATVALSIVVLVSSSRGDSGTHEAKAVAQKTP